MVRDERFARAGSLAGSGLRVGDQIHGFANGHFGRDSYACRVIEAEGRDWFVTRNVCGDPEFISRADAGRIGDPDERDYCGDECDAT